MLAPFVIPEINKIDLEELFFQNFQNPNGENLNLWVEIHFP